MNRRTSLKTAGLMMGAAAFPAIASTFLESCTRIRSDQAGWTPQFLTAEQGSLVEIMADTVIPATDTPGAADAMVQVFIDLYVRDCYSEKQQNAFIQGLEGVENRAGDRHHKSFGKLSQDDRIGILTEMERDYPEFSAMFKYLTVLGYFTSQEGATKAAVFDLDPGPFQGCIDLAPGQKVSAFKYTF